MALASKDIKEVALLVTILLWEGLTGTNMSFPSIYDDSILCSLLNKDIFLFQATIDIICFLFFGFKQTKDSSILTCTPSLQLMLECQDIQTLNNDIWTNAPQQCLLNCVWRHLNMKYEKWYLVLANKFVLFFYDDCNIERMRPRSLSSDLLLEPRYHKLIISSSFTCHLTIRKAGCLYNPFLNVLLTYWLTSFIVIFIFDKNYPNNYYYNYQTYTCWSYKQALMKRVIEKVQRTKNARSIPRCTVYVNLLY